MYKHYIPETATIEERAKVYKEHAEWWEHAKTYIKVIIFL